GIVKQNPNEQTTAFIKQIENFPTFNIKEGTLPEERILIDEGKLSIILDIPDNLLGSNQKSTITAYTNPGKAGEAQAVLSILNDSINQMTIRGAGLTPVISVN